MGGRGGGSPGNKGTTERFNAFAPENALAVQALSALGMSGNWVSMSEIRQFLGGSREKQDAALKDLANRKMISLMPEENQKTLTPARKAAAIQYGGEANHLVRITR